MPKSRHNSPSRLQLKKFRRRIRRFVTNKPFAVSAHDVQAVIDEWKRMGGQAAAPTPPSPPESEPESTIAPPELIRLPTAQERAVVAQASRRLDKS
jgi:hypothetical protein